MDMGSNEQSRRKYADMMGGPNIGPGSFDGFNDEEWAELNELEYPVASPIERFTAAITTFKFCTVAFIEAVFIVSALVIFTSWVLFSVGTFLWGHV